MYLGLYTGSFGHNYKFVYNFLLSFIITIVFLKKKKKWFLISYLIIALILTFYIFYINDFKLIALHTLSSLSLLIGLIFGCIYYFLRFKFVTLFLVLLINSFVLLYGYEIWLNKLNYGTFLGNVNYEISNNSFLYDSDNNVFKFEKDKIYVLDFWNTTCGVCFQEFPKFEKLSHKFQDKNIRFYAVNHMYKDENIYSNNVFLIDHDVSVPSLYFKGSKLELSKAFKVDAFPTVIIIQNNKVLYKGNNLTLKCFLNRIK